MMNMADRRERILELLDANLAEIQDNPLMESYQARNVNNYLQAIYTVDRIIQEEQKHE